MATQGFSSHGHEDVVHSHEHIHITHHAKGGAGGPVEHLTAVHAHDHNHSRLEHAHIPPWRRGPGARTRGAHSRPWSPHAELTGGWH
jgi:hypothetical protein